MVLPAYAPNPSFRVIGSHSCLAYGVQNETARLWGDLDEDRLSDAKGSDNDEGLSLFLF